MRERYKQVLESQEEIGQVQVFYGRFSLLWGEAHEEELRCYREEYIFPLDFELNALKDQLDILVPERVNKKDREFEKHLIEID